MTRIILFVSAGAALAIAAPAQAAGPTDPQIAHIAYTAGNLDIAAAKQALKMSHNAAVRGFAQEMVRDHEAVNNKALALVKKLKVTPEANPTSAGLTKAADGERAKLGKLKGAAFDREYINNEVAYHKTVNGALKSTLIPSANNAELKSLLETGLKLFEEHQAHAEQLAVENEVSLLPRRFRPVRRGCRRAAVGCAPRTGSSRDACRDDRSDEIWRSSAAQGRRHSLFVNKDIFRHTVTASNNSFNLDLMPGARASLHINSAGHAAFYCKYHPGMRGSMSAK